MANTVTYRDNNSGSCGGSGNSHRNISSDRDTPMHIVLHYRKGGAGVQDGNDGSCKTRSRTVGGSSTPSDSLWLQPSALMRYRGGGPIKTVVTCVLEIRQNMGPTTEKVLVQTSYRSSRISRIPVVGRNRDCLLNLAICCRQLKVRFSEEDLLLD